MQHACYQKLITHLENSVLKFLSQSFPQPTDSGFKEALVEILTTIPLFSEVTFVVQKQRPGYLILCALADVLKLYFRTELKEYERSFYVNAKSTAVIVHESDAEDSYRLKQRFCITFVEHFLNDRTGDAEKKQDKERAKTLYLFARSLLDSNTKKTQTIWHSMWNALPPTALDGAHKRLVLTQNVISFLFGGYGPTLWPTDVVQENPQAWIRTLNESHTAKFYLLDRAYGRKVTIAEPLVKNLIRRLEPKAFSSFLNKIWQNLGRL